MKIYILTCVNEDSELVLCKSYRTLSDAQADMALSAEVEREEIERAGRPGFYFKERERSAAVGDEEYCYIFNITEDEL